MKLENYNWVQDLSSELKILPLQLINCERLRRNDVVCIFDEVGCGKTVSAGLMIMDTLSNLDDPNILVITTNSMVKSSQFRDELGTLFPTMFGKKGEGIALRDTGVHRVRIINNIYSNIAGEKAFIQESLGITYDLIIIDEAHKFLEDTTAFNNLIKLKSNKVVLLTATPIKSDAKKDFGRLQQIASSIVADGKTEKLAKALDKLPYIGEADTLICGSFDPSYPITRYFKGTTGSQELTLCGEGAKVYSPKRELTYTFTYKDDSTAKRYGELFQMLVNMLKIELQGTTEKVVANKLIIYCGSVNEGSGKLYETSVADVYNGILDLGAGEFKDWQGRTSAGKWTVAKLTGDTLDIIPQISGKGESELDSVPDVLIVNYQVAEEGINLQRYNVVVNWHIPQYPSSLEQRFGRIDRICTEEIHEDAAMYYFFPNNKSSISRNNYYSAINIFRNEILPELPSRNVIFCDRLGEDGDVIDSEDIPPRHCTDILYKEDGVIKFTSNEECIHSILDSVDYGLFKEQLVGLLSKKDK